MAKQTFLAISKNNGVGLLTRPIDQSLTLNKTYSDGCLTSIYRNDGTFYKLSDHFHVYDYNTSNVSLYGCSYNDTKSLYYLRETIPVNSNVIITASGTALRLDYDVDDTDSIYSFDRGIAISIKIKNNKYPVKMYTTYSSSEYEVEYL